MPAAAIAAKLTKNPQPDRGASHRVQCVSVDDQQHIPHHKHYDRDVEHQQPISVVRAAGDGPVFAEAVGAWSTYGRLGPPLRYPGVGGGPRTVGRAVAAVPPRVAPLSTENLGLRGVRRVSEAVGTLRARRCTSAPRPGISANGASTSPTAWTPHALPLTAFQPVPALGAHLIIRPALVTSPPRTGTVNRR